MSQSLQDGQLKLTSELIHRYNVDGPRYTSYPTAPQWHDGVTAQEYQEGLLSVGREDRALSLYIHIPFCDKRCLFCACNVVIRKQKDAIGDRYLDALEKEIHGHRRRQEAEDLNEHDDDHVAREPRRVLLDPRERARLLLQAPQGTHGLSPQFLL